MQKTNYKTGLIIRASVQKDADSIYSDLMQIVHGWATRRNGKKIDWDIFKGHKEVCETFKSNSEKGKTTSIIRYVEKENTYFALREKHKDSKLKNREWTTEIIIKCNNEECFVGVTNFISDKINHFLERKDNIFSLPRIIKDIFREEDFNLYDYSGKQSLQRKPVNLPSNYDESTFISGILENDNRSLPIVLLSSENKSGNLSIDPISLQESLLGNASVYYYTDKIYGKNLSRYPRFYPFRCENGTVRIYFPNFKLNTSNPYHHVFYSADFLSNIRTNLFYKLLIDKIVRRKYWPNFYARTFSEFESEYYKSKFQHAENDQQRIIQLEKQNDSLIKQITEKENEFNSFASDYDRLEDEKGELEEKMYELNNENKTMKEHLAVQSSGNNFKKLFEYLQIFFIPQSQSDVLDIFNNISDNVEILDSAFKSAAEMKCTDIQKGWQMMKELCIDVYELHKSGERDLESKYQSSEFELALNEGTKTKKDKKLMRLRWFEYNGNEYEFTNHIKYGNKDPNLIRLYYKYFPDEDKIVVAHFGDHLDNASTRKKK